MFYFLLTGKYVVPHNVPLTDNAVLHKLELYISVVVN